MDKVKVSLLIATYNRGPYLKDTLDSVAAQTLPGQMWELVVVNNNSTDNTADVFGEFARSHPQINCRMILEPSQGVSYACNRGIAESSGEYIVIIDDDETVNEDFLRVYHDFFESHPRAAAAGGRIVGKFLSAPPSWMSPYTERPIVGTLDISDIPRIFPPGKFFGGGNMAVRRSVLDKYGAFDTNLGRSGKSLLGGEEKDLFMRLREAGEEIWYLPDAIIYHLILPEKLTPEYFRKLTLHIGKSERVRTLGVSRWRYVKRLLLEAVKWGGALVLSAWYLLRLQPAKSKYLLIMRLNITKGLIGSGKGNDRKIKPGAFLFILAALLLLPSVCEAANPEGASAESGRKGPFAYSGYSGGMMVYTGWLSAGDITLRQPGGASFTQTMEGIPTGIGGAVKFGFGKYLRLGTEGYATTLNYGRLGSYATIGWGGILADFCWDAGRIAPFAGVTLGGGRVKNVMLIESGEERHPGEALYLSYGFGAVTPFAGVEFAASSHMRIVIKADWVLRAFGNDPGYPSGPRIYIGFAFSRRNN